MFAKTPIITDAGVTCLVRAAAGETFTFTKFQLGSGVLTPQETERGMTALKQVAVDNLGITQAQDTEEDGYIMLSGSFDNQTDIQTAFRWTELGLIAEDENGNEYLYAYGYDNANAENLSPSGGTVIIEQRFSVIIAIGETENITVNILPSASYASQSDLDAHVENTNNPHGVTAQQIGAANATHTHAAGDIASGILGIERGGTGVNSLAALQNLIISQIPSARYVIGQYVGNHGARQDIALGFQPMAVLIFKPTLVEVRGINYEMENNAIIMCLRGQNYVAGGRASIDMYVPADTLFANGYGGAAITENGFAVGYASGGCVNVNGYGTHFYIAFR